MTREERLKRINEIAKQPNSHDVEFAKVRKESTELGKQIMLNKVCERLKNTMYNDDVWGVVVSSKFHSVEEFIDDLKQAMEE